MEATLIVATIIGLITAKIASNRGRNFLTWWIYGALLFISVTPLIAIKKRERPGERKSALIAKKLSTNKQLHARIVFPT